MNIFVLHQSPRLCAQWHCDTHVVKMILETAQLLYSVWWITHPDEIPEGAYKLSHKNHPCAIWARQSVQNYRWLCMLGQWLCHEYTYRYGKIHKTHAHIEWLTDHIPLLPLIGCTPFVLAMPDQYKDENPILSYRTFYAESKCKERGIVSYTRRPPPNFFRMYNCQPVVRSCRSIQT